MKTNQDIREMDDADWMSFGGAERFADGSSPLICEKILWMHDRCTQEVTAIADRNGICILNFFDSDCTYVYAEMHWSYDDGTMDESRLLSDAAAKFLGRCVLEKLIGQTFRTRDLEAMGFRINGG